MGLILILVAIVASGVPLIFIPFATGGWFLCAIVFGVLLGFLGMSWTAMAALSDHTTNFVYYGNWLVGLVMLSGWALAAYSLVMLVWRGAGIHVEVTQQ